MSHAQPFFHVLIIENYLQRKSFQQHEADVVLVYLRAPPNGP